MPGQLRSSMGGPDRSGEERHPAPDWLTGLWRRSWFEDEHGRRDETTRAFRLQTRHFYADIRVPAARPAIAAPDVLPALSIDSRQALAAVEAGAGHLELHGETCVWERAITYRPAARTVDRSRMEHRGATVIGWGVERLYIEEWARESGGGVLVAMRLLHEQDMATGLTREPRGIFVIAGDRFIYARDRDAPLSMVKPADDEDATIVSDYMACHVSYGRTSSWRVALSTQPWREARPLFAPGALRYQVERQCLRELVDGGLLIRRWSVVESTLTPERLQALLSF